ncbi:MAG: hypothetical protein ACD_75C00180G0001 [uncultured bacterium]|nr:MAG: hypothetical protein ACD_75C00180G0001 [uncultured bacterium]
MTKASIVAILGMIIPAPLAIPMSLISLSPIFTVFWAIFWTVSVVMIALATSSKLSGDNPSTSLGMLRSKAATFNCSPITPVEASWIMVSGMFSDIDRMALVIRAASMPFSPVQALAQPLFTRIAWA